MRNPVSSQALLPAAPAAHEHALAATGASTGARDVALAVDACRAALDDAPICDVLHELRRLGFRPTDAVRAMEQVGTGADALNRITTLRELVGTTHARHAMLERCLLLQSVVEYGERIARAPVGESVLSCLADELRFLARPDDDDAEKLLAPSDSFVAMAKIVTLRRFPAGQLQFERSGIPLSWFARLGPRRLTTLLRFLLRTTRGRTPFFFHHLAWRRWNRLFLLEGEQNRSYWRIAQSLTLHPEVKGLLTESWLHSPDTFQVSSHLAWLNKPFLEHGGLILVLGEAPANSGVFTASRKRKRLHAEGRFRPTTAMAVWPRAAMLEWAMKHPEFGA
jgi:hypothetical protein